MAACAITNGWNCPDCTEKFGVPGIQRDEIWIANHAEITAFVSIVTGEVSNLTFASYKGLKKLCVHKDTGLAGEELVKANNAGSHYTQSFIGRVIDDSTATRTAIEDLVDVPVVIITKKKNNKFVIIGESGDLELTENSKSTGATTGDDTGDLLTFAGTNNGKHRYFLDTDVATTQTVLDGLVV